MDKLLLITGAGASRALGADGRPMPLMAMSEGQQRSRRKLLMGSSILGLLVLVPLSVWVAEIVQNAKPDEEGQALLLIGIVVLIGLGLLVQLVWNARKFHQSNATQDHP